MKDLHGKITIRSQSFCRKCRSNHGKNQLKFKDETIVNRPNHNLPRELNSLDTENFIKDWNSGISLIDLAKKYDFSYPEKAKRIAKQLGLPSENRLNRKYLRGIDIDTENFIKDWNSGMSFVDLSIKYNLDYAEKAKRIGMNLGLKKQKNLDFFEQFLTDTKKTNEFISMYGDDSIKVREITKHFDFTDNGYVSRLAKKIGIPIRFGGFGSLNKFEQSKDEFSKMWNANIDYKIIMKKLDISNATIHTWRVNLGLKPRARGRREFPDAIKNKIELLLLENSGALTSKEIKNLLNKQHLNLTDAYKSMKFQRLSLTLHMTGRRARQPTDYFGDNTGNTIIFLHGMYDSLILKLSKILKEGNMYKHNLLKKSVYKFMISRLAENEKEIENRASQLFQILYNKGKQNEFESFVKVQLKKYSIKEKSIKSISKIKSNDPLIDQIIENMPKSIFYGRKFESEFILNELDSAYPDQQKTLVQEIFTPFNFICTTLNDGYFDLKITSNESFLIRFMLHQLINSTTLNIFQSKLNGKKGIIINFEFISESVLKTIPENIQIFNKNDLFSLLNSIEFLPIRPNSFAKIMFGKNKDEIVFCNDVDFETNIATISDSNKKIDNVSIKFLKHIKLPKDISFSDYFDFIKKLDRISVNENISSMDECIVDVTSINTGYLPMIDSKVDSNLTKILLLDNSSDQRIGNDNYTSAGFLRNTLIKCNCLSWISQENPILCKHSIALLFHMWKGPIAKFDKGFERKTVEDFLDYVSFLINYSIKMENFWFEKIDHAKVNWGLIHHAICNLIDGEIFKTSNYEESEKSELENLMFEYKNENNNLFDSMTEIHADQRKMIRQFLNYQFKEKMEELKKSS